MLRDISWRHFDFWLLGAIVLATAFGTTMIRSAVAGNEELVPLINRQIYFAVLVEGVRPSRVLPRTLVIRQRIGTARLPEHVDLIFRVALQPTLIIIVKMGLSHDQADGAGGPAP